MGSIEKRERKMKFDHIGIVVKDLDKAIKFYSEVFGFRIPETGPYSKILEIDQPGYKIRYVLLEANGVYIELLEPKKGPWLKRLEERGEGSIWEVCFEVEDIDEAYDEFNNMGITPTDRFDRPLAKGRYTVSPSGARFMHLPLDKTYGTWIEILDRPWKRKHKG